MTTPALHFSPLSSLCAVAPLRGLARWRQRAAQARRQRDERRVLMALGQHELNDLGVGHSELAQVLRGARD